ncbi:MAG TPA: FmdB family zinc ribbon protein [Abditibacteriaceae bacterium]|nr:FmdB family zinc ribbon protein [Abditibacteriaceae bacterium]
MPNYEYQCTACDHIFELWQPVGEAAPACPECESAVKKIFHAPRVIFKGSGFYVTDLRAEKSASQSSTANHATAAKEGTPASDSSSTEKTASTAVKSENGSSPAPIADKPAPAA